MPPDWSNFYFMVGSAGGGLIGLLFVVVTLTSNFDQSAVTRGLALYLTPTALHFAIVLMVSALALMPGLPAGVFASALGIAALTGLARAIRSCLGIRGWHSGHEPPHWSDFWLYGMAPAFAYAGLGLAAAGFSQAYSWAPFAVAAALLAVLFLGIHNAWDLITWMAPRRQPAGQ